MVEEVGDLNYRLTLPPYMKIYPVVYGGRLKRYVDPKEIKYSHRSNATDRDVDCESSVVAGEDKETENSFPSMSDSQRTWRASRTPCLTRFSSSPASLTSPSEDSSGHTLTVLRTHILQLRSQSRGLTLESGNPTFQRSTLCLRLDDGRTRSSE